jgi:tetratricopeptide (TPR) repeat protein
MQVQSAYEAASAHPESSEAVAALALMYHAYERYEAATECYSRLRQLAPAEPGWAYLAGVAWDALGKPAEALAAFRQASAIPAARLRYAESLLKSGRVQEAAAEAERLVAEQPSLARAHYTLGRALEREGNLAAAAGAYQKAAEMAPRAGEPRYALAMLHRRTGDSQAARSAMQEFEKCPKEGFTGDDPWMDRVRAARRDPGYYVEEGRRALAAGDLDQALAGFQRALEMDPHFGAAHANLVAAYGAAGRVRDAERHYRAAIAARVNADELHTNWGIVLLSARRPAEARQAFRDALSVNPRSADALANLGVSFLREGNRAEAAASFRRAIEADPAHRPARLNLGKLLVSERRFDEGLSHLRRAADVQDEQAAKYRYALADACNKAGRRREAIENALSAAALARQYGQADLESQIQAGLKILRSGK